MKSIKLITASEFFSEHLFAHKMINHQERITFRFTEEETLDTSIFYTLLTDTFEMMPNRLGSKDEKAIEYMCITDEFFVIVTAGETGYKTSHHYFDVMTTEKDDVIEISISSVSASAVTDKLQTVSNQNEYQLHELLNDAFCDNLGIFEHCKYPADVLTNIESTPFLRMNSDTTSLIKVKARVTDDGFYLRDHSYSYLKKTLNNSNASAGDLVYNTREEFNDFVQISEIQSFAHDIYGNFFALIKPILEYPRDAAEIKEKYPEFYAENCMSTVVREMNKILSDAKAVPYISEEYSLGDDIICLPLDTSHKDLGITQGIFQYTIHDDRHYTHFNKGHGNVLRFLDGMSFCTLIEYKNRFKIMMYTYNSIVRYKENFFAVLKYDTETEYFNSLTDHWFRESSERQAYITAKYLLYRGEIQPLQAADESFFRRLDTE